MKQQSTADMTGFELSSTLNTLTYRMRSALAVCGTINEAMPYGPTLNCPEAAAKLIEEAQWLVSAVSELLHLAAADADKLEQLLD
jgi:hypothetical protein